MIKLNNAKEVVEIPDKWSELTPDQFIKVIILYNEMISGECNVLEFRLKLLKMLSGYQRGKARFDEETAENIDSNLLILSQMLTLALKPVYTDPEVMGIFSEELQEFLTTNFPFDATAIHHLQQLAVVGDRLKWYPSLDLNFGINPMPHVTTGKHIRFGPVFDVDSCGIISTDMIVDEYIDALEYLKHNLGVNLECNLPFGITEEFDFYFRKRIGSEKYFLMDTTLYKDTELKKGNMLLFLKLTNIFNVAYTEENEVKMPGFGLSAGGTVKF